MPRFVARLIVVLAPLVLLLAAAPITRADDALDMHPLLTGGIAELTVFANRTLHDETFDADTAYRTTVDESSQLSFHAVAPFVASYGNVPDSGLTLQDLAPELAYVHGRYVGSSSVSFDNHSTWIYENGCDPAPCSGSDQCSETVEPLDGAATLHPDATAPLVVGVFGLSSYAPKAGCDQWGSNAWVGDDKPGGVVFRLPDEPYEGAMPYLDQTTDLAGDICFPYSDDCTPWRHQSGSSHLVVSCALCFQKLTFEQHDLPSGDWTAVPDTGTFDGNDVRISFTVHNAWDEAIDQAIRFRDATTNTDLAAYPGAPALTRIQVPAGETREFTFEWDTDGVAWKPGASEAPHRIELLTALGGARAGIVVRPRPVLLLHGLNSTADTWSTYPRMFHDARPGWIARAVRSMNTDPAVGNHVATNAKIAWTEIQETRNEFDAQHVDLVGHSMGGLISRQVLQDEQGVLADGTPVVSRLVQLGTPNRGSVCANVAIAIAPETRGVNYLPLLELSPVWVEGTFNRTVTATRGTKLSVLAGAIGDLNTLATVTACQLEVPNDSIVSRTSAWWTIADHSIQNGLAHTDMTKNQAAFDSWVKPHLAKPARAASGAGRARRRAGAKQDRRATSASVIARTGPMLEQVGTRTIQGSGMLTVRRSSAAPFEAVVLARAGMRIELVDPTGHVVGSDATTAGDLILAVRAARGARGTWTIRVTGAHGAVGHAVRSVAVRALAVRITAKPNGKLVRVLATFAAGRSGGTVSLHRPGSTIALHDDGRHGDGRAHDGVFGGQLAMRAGTTVAWNVHVTSRSGAASASLVLTRTR